MMKCTSLVSVLLVLAMASVTPAGDWQPFAVAPTESDQEYPDIYGNIIVWHEIVAGQSYREVYGAELTETESVFFYVSASEGYNQTNPSIWEDKVVWQDERAGYSTIYITDITEPFDLEESAVQEIEGIDQNYPAVSGDTVVWTEFTDDGEGGGDIDIFGAHVYASDFATYFNVAFEFYDQKAPAIFRNNVVYQDDASGTFAIIAADIWQIYNFTPQDTLYTENIQQNPSVFGDMVVWQEEYPDGHVEIWAADISNPAFPAKFGVCTTPSLKRNPDIAENLIVWQDYRNGNWDIYGYNLTTAQEFRITIDGADQINPAVSGNIVVWQDLRDGYWNIYAAELFGAEVAQCDIRPEGDVNGDCAVNMTDLAALAANWLTCGLYPENACP